MYEVTWARGCAHGPGLKPCSFGCEAHPVHVVLDCAAEPCLLARWPGVQRGRSFMLYLHTFALDFASTPDTRVARCARASGGGRGGGASTPQGCLQKVVAAHGAPGCARWAERPPYSPCVWHGATVMEGGRLWQAGLHWGGMGFIYLFREIGLRLFCIVPLCSRAKTRNREPVHAKPR